MLIPLSAHVTHPHTGQELRHFNSHCLALVRNYDPLLHGRIAGLLFIRVRTCGRRLRFLARHPRVGRYSRWAIPPRVYVHTHTHTATLLSQELITLP